MRLSVNHRSHYKYSQPQHFAIQYLRLTPSSDASQRVIDWTLKAPGRLTRQIDGFGNILHVMTLNSLHDEVEVAVQGTVDSFDTGGVIPAAGNGLSPLLYLRPTPLTEATGVVRDFAEPGRAHMRTDPLAGMHELSRAVARRVLYRPGTTDVETTAGNALAAGTGVCQDQAHVLTAAARHLGVPTRYVSGYVHVTGDGGDETASHAWCESWIENLGWVAFDVTNQICANDAHIRLAVGPDYLACAPIRGMRRGGGAEKLDVHVTVAAMDQ
jgi:transglutaminase-like putative cysteine protease